MSFFDALLGRTRPVESKIERLFAISTAQVSLELNVGLVPAGAAGICFKPVASGRFEDVRADLDALLKISTRATSSVARVERDTFGFAWVVVQDTQFEDLVSTIHMVTLTLQEQGFGGQLLAAAFRFTRAKEGTEPLPGALDPSVSIYWVYNYKRGKFYPFVPRQAMHERENALELRLEAAMSRELPIEPEHEKWYAMWGLPL